VLKDISFKVAANETVAFVGATGSGKTTILQLIVRNYDIQKGQILIDGIDIKKIKRSSLRAFVGQMLQDVFLFSGTIRENITLRNENIPEAKILESTHYVGLDQVLKRLPNGLNEEVKERGKNFSAGERQLISFARAVTYQPSVMILDEATANIDSETEAIIQESLAKMMNISTMLIVAHRLSTIQHCDKIFVMHKGEIVETGNHQTLLQKNGLYYNLYRLQHDQQKREENNILQVTN
jgi:ATP-binding cassette subfamily B protein